MQTSSASLSLVRFDAYLQDLRAWVTAKCRTAIAIAVVARELGPMPRLILEALLAEQASSRRTDVAHARILERDAVERLASWRDSAPHLELGRELGLSATSVAILVLGAAPALWSNVAQIYRVIARAKGYSVVDERLVCDLLGTDAANPTVVARELDPAGPLVGRGACRFGRGPRPDASILVDPAIVLRLAGGPELS